FRSPLAGHERLGLGDVEIVELELALAADLERVAEARRRHEAGHRPLALDERVCEQGRRVHDPREVARLEAAVAEDRADAANDGAHRIVAPGHPPSAPP